MIRKDTFRCLFKFMIPLPFTRKESSKKEVAAFIIRFKSILFSGIAQTVFLLNLNNMLSETEYCYNIGNGKQGFCTLC